MTVFQDPATGAWLDSAQWLKCRACGGTFRPEHIDFVDFPDWMPFYDYPCPCPFCWASPDHHQIIESEAEMGDHRATVKIRFEFHGIVSEQEFWINWWPDDSGIDQRIVQWFSEKAADGYHKFNTEMAKAGQAERERRTREHELAELTRLKAKYPDSTQ